ncbi:stalk domain-containing protein [Cohnella silvisoli]|uniref:Phosphodiester glycosidase family protein n=1 Tax=Cohnella silvisoli TaxID=2873699 RepID=A0ABV1KQA0_9BACL|nr:phosphodiester glycosidase family protein [Cohnella silvisoli]MCD9022293.1 phosphodiester glycosidase family protein [Cohnella silvisoli]
MPAQTSYSTRNKPVSGTAKPVVTSFLTRKASPFRHKPYRIILPLLAGVLVFTAPLNVGGFSPVAHAATTKAVVTYKLVKQSESIVTSGARQINYAWVPSDTTKPTEMLHILQIDLKNPYIQLNAMSGQKGSVTTGQSVGAMVKETGAVAGINGDVFGTSNEGAPLGAQINSGQLFVSTAQLKGMYAFAVTADRQPIIDEFSFTGSVTAADGVTSFTLTGLNKSAYRTEPNSGFSHVDALYMYTSAWTAPERPMASSSTPTEALVVDGIVTEISAGSAIKTAIPANGYILRGHKTAADFITNSLKVGDTINASYSLQSLKTGQTYDPSSFQMMVSGHTLLLDNGVAVPFTRDINGVSGSADRARTAVGYSKDGGTAYLLTVEENGGRNGVTLKELQQMLVEIGVWKAVNLDGGGSTTMISRPLGEFQTVLAHPTSYGTSQRQVANGIGVYTTAPQGTLKGIAASGERTLFIGQQSTYSLKAYDSYYNPMDPNGLQPIWKLDKPLGSLLDGTFQAAKPGTATLSVKAGSASDTIPLEVIGSAQVSQLIVEPNTTVLKPGVTINVPVKVQLTDGRQLSVPASSVTWEFRGFTASVSNGKITVDQVQNNIAAGYAIARYDGFGGVAVLAPGTEQTLENFENVTYNVGFTATPAETVGTSSIVTGTPGRETSKVLLMDYDFTNGSGKRYANAVLNDGKGIGIAGSPSSLTLDVLGDQSMNWLRAELTDVNGKTVYITMANQIDWSGWKNIRVDLAAAGLKGPAKLTKLYIVNQEEGQDERALQGQLGFDNLNLQYPPSQINVNHPTIVMTVGKTQGTVDGVKVKLPGAPFVQKETSTNYLPLKFVADTLGAQVIWDNIAKRVTVLRGDKMLELWVGNESMTVNGVRLQTAVAPVVIKGSIYVPVRVISEQLGQKVEWEGKAKTITIH